MKCSNAQCQKELPDGVHFCRRCGTKTPVNKTVIQWKDYEWTSQGSGRSSWFSRMFTARQTVEEKFALERERLRQKLKDLTSLTAQVIAMQKRGDCGSQADPTITKGIMAIKQLEELEQVYREYQTAKDQAELSRQAESVRALAPILLAPLTH